MSTEMTARQLVVVVVGSGEYALPIESVQEIIRYDEPRSVASPIRSVRGVISLRGAIIPIYDVAERLSQPSVLSERTKIVIVGSDAGTAGVIVDEVVEVMTVAAGDLQCVPGGESELTDGIAVLGDRLIVILEPSAVAVDLELQPM